MLALTLAPTGHARLAPAAFRHYVERNHPCLARIIGMEGYWDTTIDYGGSPGDYSHDHGNTDESYGIGQANPGWKMAPYGRDWRTNPWTQLKWMQAYVSRYGGECAALNYRLEHGSY